MSNTRIDIVKKPTFTEHLNRIRGTSLDILPRKTDYAVTGTVNIGDEERMRQLAEGKIKGTWEKRSLARGLAMNILDETQSVLADIDLTDPNTVREVVRQETKFYADPRYRAGEEGSTIAAGVARVILLKIGK